MSDGTQTRTLAGRLVGMAGKATTDEVTVWLAVKTTAGESATYESITDEYGDFSFDLPDQPLRSARVGALLSGVQPVDLDPQDQRLAPREVVLLVDDFIPSHIRYGGG